MELPVAGFRLPVIALVFDNRELATGNSSLVGMCLPV
jgi:hypothetical protein